MKVEILRSVLISGEPVSAGSLAEVSNSDANLLIGMGKARLFVEAEPATVEAPKKSRKAPAPAPTVTEEA